LFPDDNDTARRQRWLKTHKDYLARGHIPPIIDALHHHPELAAYFQHHQRRMQSLEFRENGFPIGSGTVERAVKQFKLRLTGTGMRWNPANAQRLLIIRAAVLGKDFHALWDNAA